VQDVGCDFGHPSQPRGIQQLPVDPFELKVSLLALTDVLSDRDRSETRAIRVEQLARSCQSGPRGTTLPQHHQFDVADCLAPQSTCQRPIICGDPCHAVGQTNFDFRGVHSRRFGHAFAPSVDC
jgi:hypothetical protein